MHILLTGGGTAGHVIPNIAIHEHIKEHNPDVRFTYLGSHEGIEKQLCEKAGLTFESIATGKWRRYFDLNNLVDLFRIPLGIGQAYFKLKRLKPTVIFSKGGYVAFPVVFAAWLQDLPVCIHESDTVPGLSTKLCTPFAQKILLAHKESQTFFKGENCEITGNPIRETLEKGEAKCAQKQAGFEGKKPVLLVMGGSTGSQQLNEKIKEARAELLKHFDLVHLTGEGKGKAIKEKGYFAVPFLGEELKDFYALAERAFSRAGAGALAELEALSLPALLLPLGLNASRGDQVENAKALCKRNSLFHLYKQEQDLLTQLLALPKRPAQKKQSTSALEKIARILLSFAS